MQEKKSGIEHAQLKRFELFNDNHTDSRIVIRDWDPNLHINTNASGIPDEQLISMFDYFQNAMMVPNHKVTRNELDFGVIGTHDEFEPEEHRALVYTAENQLVARINYMADDERIASTELFDGFNNLYRVDQYDSRGFISLSQWYTPDNKIGTETWQTPDGQTILETFNRDDVMDERQKSGWRLTDQDGTIRQFDSIEQLTLHFFDLLNEEFWSNEHPNVFVLDRAHLGDWGLQHLKKPAYTVLHLHNSHAVDAQEPMDSILNNHYEFSMNAINGYDAVVSATNKQTDDVRKRFNPTTSLFTIPVGVVSDKQLNSLRVPVKQRQFGKVIAFARIAWEKHLYDLVRAVGIAHK